MAEPRLEGKRWSKNLELPIAEEWKKKKVYTFDPKSKKKVYSIDTPPPYVNKPIHMGHATTYTIMDMIARHKRMTGHNVLFPLGLDRNGLPIEVAAEKKFGVVMTETPRDKFVGMCKKVLEASSAESTDSFLKLGHSYNSWKTGPKIGDAYFTDSDEYRMLTQNTFIDLWAKGKVREDARVNNYCPHCKTTIADSEIEYKDFGTTFHHVKFKIKGSKESITIATTRPELLGACAMILYNPEDKRYKKLKGKTAIVPIYGIEVPIKAHPYAKMDAGSGLVMMCSFGDYTDVRFFREEKIKPKFLISQNGTMTKDAGFLAKLPIKDAQKKIVEKLEKEKLIIKQEKVLHRTPICERSKTPIEFIAMKEYYLDQLDYKETVRKDQKKIRFFAEKSRQILTNWIDTVSMDWPVSRRRYYATEIPIWYCEKCGETYVPPKGKYYKPWKNAPPVKKCPKCGNGKFRGEERVFDTWFDSSISPLYIMGYGRNDAFFKTHAPCSLRPQGKEIVRTWLYYTLLRCHQLTGKNIFDDVWVHYHVLDDEGIKMSKSLGNIIDPHEIIEKFGAEPFRMWCALEGNIDTTDLRCSFDRIEGVGKFLIKFWNVSRFISMFPKPPKKRPKLSPLDEWILYELDKLVKYTGGRYNHYDFHGPAARIKNFLTETFASNYLELAKNRAYNSENDFSKDEQKAALWTLNRILETCLRLLAPITPFITYKIYGDLYKADVHFEPFPETEKLKKSGIDTTELLGTNSAVWKAKKDANVSLKSDVKELTIPKSLKAIEKDLATMHHAQKVKFGKEVKVKL